MAMALPITGACLCGQVSYVCSKPPVWSCNCHCRACQKLSGAPYVTAFSVLSESFEQTGDLICFERIADSGHEVRTYHCADCGTRVFAQSAGALHLTNIFASTLPDQSEFKPISNVFLAEAASWIEPPEAKLNFPGMPET